MTDGPIIDLEVLGPGSTEEPKPMTDINSHNLLAGIYIKKRDDILNKDVRLVTSVEVIDGEVHSAHTRGYNEDKGTANTWHLKADDLYANWIIEPKGGEIRAEQRAILTNKVQVLQQNLRILTANRPQPPKLLAAPSNEAEAKSSEGALVEYKKQMGEFQGSVQLVSKDMADTSSRLAVLLEENAKLMEAQISDVLEEIQTVETAVTSLQAFCLEHTYTKQIASGEPAALGDKIYLYQQMLYIDEELMAHSLIDGRDHRDVDTIGRAFKSDPALLDRLIPSKRGAVLMQASRSMAPYEGMKDAWSMLENMKADETKILLTRNGEQVHATYIPRHIYEKMTNLFPSEVQFRKIFQDDWTKKQLDWTDLKYAEARDKFERTTLAYRRMLLIIAGIQLKYKVFGPFEDINPMSLTQAHYHADKVVYVHDEELLPDNSRPDVDEWLRHLTSDAQPGDLVLVRRAHLNNGDVTPALGRYDQHSSKMYFNWKCSAESEWLIHKTQGNTDTGVFITENFEYDGYSDAVTQRERKARCFINKEWTGEESRYRGYSVGFIRLNHTSEADIFYYLNSRRARESFHKRFGLLERALNEVRKLRVPKGVSGRKQAAMLAGLSEPTWWKPHPKTVLTTYSFDGTYTHYTIADRPKDPELDSLLGETQRYIVTTGRSAVPSVTQAKKIVGRLPVITNPTKYYDVHRWTEVDEQQLRDENYRNGIDTRMVTLAEKYVARRPSNEDIASALGSGENHAPIAGITADDVKTMLTDLASQKTRRQVPNCRIVIQAGVEVDEERRSVTVHSYQIDALDYWYWLDPEAALKWAYSWYKFPARAEKLQAGERDLQFSSETAFYSNGWDEADVPNEDKLPLGIKLEEGYAHGWKVTGDKAERMEQLAETFKTKALVVNRRPAKT